MQGAGGQCWCEVMASAAALGAADAGSRAATPACRAPRAETIATGLANSARAAVSCWSAHTSGIRTAWVSGDPADLVTRSSAPGLSGGRRHVDRVAALAGAADGHADVSGAEGVAWRCCTSASMAEVTRDAERQEAERGQRRRAPRRRRRRRTSHARRRRWPPAPPRAPLHRSRGLRHGCCARRRP